MPEFEDEIYGIDYKSLKDKQKKKRKGKRKSDRYISLTEHERVYVRSHIYGGSHAAKEKSLPIFDSKTQKIIQKVITIPDLLARFFFEGITNCTDNTINSRNEGVSSKHVKITVDKHSVSFENDGNPIPLLPNKEVCDDENFGTNVDLIFGKLGSGSNLDDDYERNSAGTNGIGAKLINVFSTKFKVEVGDNINGVHQIVKWKRNMFTKEKSVCTPPYIRKQNKKGKYKWVLDDSQKKYDGPNFVKISYTTDFRKFKEDHYTHDDIAFFKAMAINSSFAAKVIVEFNGEKLDYRDINNYAKLFNAEDIKNKLVIYTFPKDVEVPEDKKEKLELIRTGKLIPKIELCMLCTPNVSDKDFFIANTNGVYNNRGGIHVEESYKTVIGAIKKIVLNDPSYGIGEEDRKKINVTFLKKNVTLIVNFNCKDPDFESQMKNELTGCPPKEMPKINISNESVKSINKWEILKMIYDKFNKGKKAPINKKRIVDEKFRDASYVGKKGKETILIPCEGKSAGEFLDIYIMEKGKMGEGGFKVYARYPMRGKLPNISGKTNRQIDKPEKSGKENELVRFMNIVGLRDGVDYTTEKGIDSLRYKKVQVMVDADDDGMHILCLLINFFYRRFPTFIKAKRLSWVFTPIMRVIKPNTKKTIKTIYNKGQYNDWLKENPNVKHDIEYFKGLAAASPDQAREDARESPNIVLYFDKLADIYLNVAFDQYPGSSEKRKSWIIQFKDNINKEILRTKKDKETREKYSYVWISDIINTKLIEFSFETLPRGIPGEDQLKISIRMIMAWIIEKYKFGKSKAQAERMGVMANMAAGEFKYHHAPEALVKALALFTLDFAGSNNLPFLTHESMTGSREFLGKNVGSGRYVKGKLNWWIKYLLMEDMYNMIPKNIVEGTPCEPKMIPFLIPPSLPNGIKGISTGWSSSLPNYHPADLTMFVYRYISDKKVFPMIPWFIRYKGQVTLMRRKITKKKSKRLETIEELEEQLQIDKKERYEKDMKKQNKLDKKLKISKDESDDEKKSKNSDKEPKSSKSDKSDKEPKSSKSDKSNKSGKSKKEEEDDEEEEIIDEDEDDDEDEPDEIRESKKLYGLILKTEGIYKIKNQYEKQVTVEEDDPDNYGEKIKTTKTITCTDFVVTEVPIGIEPAKLVIKYAKNSDETYSEPKNEYTPYIIVKGYTGSMEPEQIGMVSYRSLSNLTFITSNGIPVTYDNVYQSIVAYCELIKKLFKKRREQILDNLNAEAIKLTKKAELIRKVVEKEWAFIKRKRDVIRKELVEFEISYDIFKSIGSDLYTEEGYEETLKDIGNIKSKIKNLKNEDVYKEWKEALMKFHEELEKREEYKKRKIHEYDIVKCSIDELTSGKILAPYKLEKIKKIKKIDKSLQEDEEKDE